MNNSNKYSGSYDPRFLCYDCRSTEDCTGCDCDCHRHPEPKRLRELGIRSSMSALEALDIFEVDEVEDNITVFSKLSDYMYQLYCCILDSNDHRDRYLRLYDVVLEYYLDKYDLKDFDREAYRENRYDYNLDVPIYPSRDSILEFIS